MSDERSGVFAEERLTMARLLSATLMALAIGSWVTEHSAEAASYAGGASTRCCQVPQECGGHTQYQIQPQTLLPPGTEAGYATRQGNCVRHLCETGMPAQPITFL